MISRTPFAGIVFFYIAGIFMGKWLISCPIPAYEVFLSLFLIFSAIGGWFYFIRQKTGTGICFSLVLLCLGAFVTVEKHNQLFAGPEQLQRAEYSCYEAVVKSLPEKRTKTLRVEAAVVRIRSGQKWITTDTRALLNITSDASVIPRPGDHIMVSGVLKRPDEALNPGQFDYRGYLENKGILWTDYLREGSLQIIGSERNNHDPFVWSIAVSEWADGIFRKNITDDRAYGLIKAMLLGRREDLRADQVDDYITSGTVHILSVSGMHVAIIFLVISFMLGWLKRWHTGRLVYLFSIVLMLGFYALVTGLPPSVQRATLMCIVFVIAEVFARKHQSMNTLCLSAFLILLFDPSALYDVGFQLSYLAMAGIFLFYEPICSVFTPSNWLTKYVWQITALSFAAQLTTFPLSLYYFHQFPTYFWLVNPFVIAFTNVLLPAALLLLFVNVWSPLWLQNFVAWVVDITAYLANCSVSVPKFLPGYLIENLYLDKVEVVFLFVMLFFVWYSYYGREYIYLKFAYLTVCIFAIYSLSNSLQLHWSPSLMVHSVPRHAVVSMSHGSKLYIASDESFRTDSTAYGFYLRNYATSLGTNHLIFSATKGSN
ncbi:ComEC/Rec2 family competence protein [Dyadobacter bucti]|uniref:ComEC/Rec2 family competence protein n=1 Tax=Dyadobacter bucti TaxID=2572203 RepID=UPI0011097ED9|nr:ComEC/Rec2 family competence protein [Dyadobacter bucti]